MATPNYALLRGGRPGANVGPSRTCCWIEGERPYGENPYCGETSVSGTSYCADHGRRVFKSVPVATGKPFVLP